MTWRAMASLLVLRDQVDAIAPDRSRASDGLLGNAAHAATTSDHNPHPVAGVGSEIVTALDLTHDPAHGFNSYGFAEALRLNRDPRIKYVISDHEIFSSYPVGGSPAWSWRAYAGDDPHTNHVHVSVLDAPIADTRTLWTLGDFDVSAEDVVVGMSQLLDQAAKRSTPTGRNFANDLYVILDGRIEVALKPIADQLASIATPAVDVAALAAAITTPDVLAAIAKAVNDDSARRQAA